MVNAPSSAPKTMALKTRAVTKVEVDALSASSMPGEFDLQVRTRLSAYVRGMYMMELT